MRGNIDTRGGKRSRWRGRQWKEIQDKGERERVGGEWRAGGKVEWHREGEWRKTVKMGNGKGERQLEADNNRQSKYTIKMVERKEGLLVLQIGERK